LKMNLARNRAAEEAPLAVHLHQLLSEIFDGSNLPDPDLAKDPDAAAKLAAIAISGKVPGEAATPAPTGMSWVWPAVIVVGGIALVLTTLIRSNAETAQEKERLQCIQSGACTDYGFWLKVAGIATVGWILWDKVGLRERFGRKKKR